MNYEARSAGGVLGQTAVAGTPIVAVVPPRRGLKARITDFAYTPGATTHTGAFLQPLGRTTVAADAAAGANPVVLTADPGVYSATTGGVPSVADNPIAVNDWVMIEKPDQTWLFVKITALTGLSLTVGTLPAGGVKAGARVFFFGLTTDTVPDTGLPHPPQPLPTGSQTVQSNTQHGFIGANRPGDPVVFFADNITAAGKLDRMAWVYGLESGAGQGVMGDGEACDPSEAEFDFADHHDTSEKTSG